jgi:hypothetical protein
LVYDTDLTAFYYFESVSHEWKAFASGAFGTGNQLLGMNGLGTANEYKTLLGTDNQIYVFHSPGSITLSTPQNIDLAASPTFLGLTISSLTPNAGVYTNNSSGVTSVPPTSGTIGYWDRNGTILSPTGSGDYVTTSGNIYTTGVGTITAAGLLTGSSGLTVTGGVVNLNENQAFATNINTGTSTGAVTIGGTGTQTISVGNGAGAKTVNLGSNNTTSNTTILSGTSGAVSLNNSAGGAVTNIGTGTTTGAVSIGGTGVQNINIGTNLTGTSNVGLGSTSSTTDISS